MSQRTAYFFYCSQFTYFTAEMPGIWKHHDCIKLYFSDTFSEISIRYHGAMIKYFTSFVKWSGPVRGLDPLSL